ncbi:MAG: uL22 family ribosomal protein [Nanoarchaeota archaeon]
MTEKNYNPEQRTEKMMKHQERMQKVAEPGAFKQEKKGEDDSVESAEKNIIKETEQEKKESPISEKKEKAKEKPRKTRAVVNGSDIPVSTKHSIAICRFIKRKKIQKAIEELEMVSMIRKAVPMKGEIPHRKGRIMSGRFPEKAAREFIVLLKSLSSNSTYNGLKNPIIVEAVANIGSRPFGRRGIRRKRTHIKIVAEDAKVKNIPVSAGKTEKNKK